MFYRNAGIALLLSLSLFACREKDSVSVVETPDGTPVIIEQPKSATYLEHEKIQDLTLVAETGDGYTLSYQWYVMDYRDYKGYYSHNVRNHITEEIISVEIDKLLNDDSTDLLFMEIRGETKSNCRPYGDEGRPFVYICIVTSTSLDGSETFITVSNPAIVTIILHPLKYWWTADKSPFTYKIYFSDFFDRFMRLKNIAYGNGYFVAVGDRYDDPYVNRPMGSFGVIAYSSDRINWNLVKDHVFNEYGNSINAIAHGNNRFVAVGTNGKVAYSDDAVTWNSAEQTVTNYFNGIVYGNGYFVASSGSGFAYSEDGETWFAVKDFDTEWISCIAFGNGLFIAGSQDGKISCSKDGKIWNTIADKTFDSHGISTICFGNGRFLALARSNDDNANLRIAYSDDGETWHSFVPSIDHERYYKNWSWIVEIIYGEGYFVAIGDDKIAYSTDGLHWDNLGESYERSYARGTEIKYNAITYGGGFFVALSDNGIIENCQWPIDHAVAPLITQDPQWPSDDYSADDQAYRLYVRMKYRSFGEHSYQWYKNDIDNSTTGTAIEGADRWFYIPDVSNPGATYYYVKVTNTIQDYFDLPIEKRSASVTSNVVAVIVEDDVYTEIPENELSSIHVLPDINEEK